MAKIAQRKKILLSFDKGLRHFLPKKWKNPCAFVDIGPYIEELLDSAGKINYDIIITIAKPNRMVWLIESVVNIFFTGGYDDGPKGVDSSMVAECPHIYLCVLRPAGTPAGTKRRKKNGPETGSGPWGHARENGGPSRWGTSCFGRRRIS